MCLTSQLSAARYAHSVNLHRALLQLVETLPGGVAAKAAHHRLKLRFISTAYADAYHTCAGSPSAFLETVARLLQMLSAVWLPRSAYCFVWIVGLVRFFSFWVTVIAIPK